MARVARLSLVCGALLAAVALWGGHHAAALSPWKHGAELVSDVVEAANTGASKVLDAAGDVAARGFNDAVSEARGIGRQLVKEGTSVAGVLTGELVGRFLEAAGLNSTCAGEAAAGCRQVVAELVTEYLDVDDVPLTPNGLLEALRKRILVHPGTKWCGAGNVARNLEDSGVLAATDACCRSHDECPENLSVGEERYGLENTCSFTRSHCECDREFYRCLKDAHTLVSLKIGIIYFTILRPQCYEENYPVARCRSRSLPGIAAHCGEYELDRSEERLWQWFDNPLF